MVGPSASSGHQVRHTHTERERGAGNVLSRPPRWGDRLARARAVPRVRVEKKELLPSLFFPSTPSPPSLHAPTRTHTGPGHPRRPAAGRPGEGRGEEGGVLRRTHREERDTHAQQPCQHSSQHTHTHRPPHPHPYAARPTCPPTPSGSPTPSSTATESARTCPTKSSARRPAGPAAA